MRHLLPALLLFTACGPQDEDDPALCADRADNDKDGLVDCMEPACAAFCATAPGTTPSPTPRDTGRPTPTDTDDRDSATATDTAPVSVRLGGTVRLEDTWSPVDFRIELLGSGLPPVYTDSSGRWAMDVVPGTYPWRITPPLQVPVPTTGTELTVRVPASTLTDTGTDVYDQTFDVRLPSFRTDGPLPLFQVQLATGLIVSVETLTPPPGEEESETLGATLASTPLPIEGVQQVHLMYHLRPYGHVGNLSVDLLYPLDPAKELWALDPNTGRWRSFGGFIEVGGDQISATQVVPFVTTLAVVTP